MYKCTQCSRLGYITFLRNYFSQIQTYNIFQVNKIDSSALIKVDKMLQQTYNEF